MSLFEQLQLSKDSLHLKHKFWIGDTIITSAFVGREIEVYNGKYFKMLKISELMVGYKLGQFIFTRRVGAAIHKSKKLKKN